MEEKVCFFLICGWSFVLNFLQKPLDCIQDDGNLLLHRLKDISSKKEKNFDP